MTRLLFSILLLLTTLPALAARKIEPFDDRWLFLQGDSATLKNPDYPDESTLRVVNLPHDWSIEGTPSPSAPTRGGGGFMPSGVAWYRKHLPNPAPSQKTFIEFDGVMENSEVYLNGQLISKRPNGYVSFTLDLTDKLRPNDNILAVKTDTSKQPASRWYTGAGIYRHVRLITTSPLHFTPYSTFITTPNLSPDKADLQVQTTILNSAPNPANFTLLCELFDSDGKSVKAAKIDNLRLDPNKWQDAKISLSIPNPKLWNLDNPHLYTLVTRVIMNSLLQDEIKTPVGLRTAQFKPDSGFHLNGVNLKLKGVCLHHEAGPLGAAVPLSVWQRRLNLLKSIGCNSIRTAHNPPSPEFLDLCDQMGFLVMDEFFDCWTSGKNSYDYHLYFNDWSDIDASDTILRDRNHPSVILYSVGNEIHDTPKEELANQILARLIKVCHEADPTRPVTQGLFRPNVSHDFTNGLAAKLDVVGVNYRDNELLDAWKLNPTWNILCTEQSRTLSTWLRVRDNPQHAGQFIWTGFDYLGEAGAWPNIAFNSGFFDRTNRPRAAAFERASWWSDKPMVYVGRVDGRANSSDPGAPMPVYDNNTPRNPSTTEEYRVFSNCDSVELFVNNISQGSKPQDPNLAPRVWKLPFEKGPVKAVAKNKDQIVATHEIQSADAPVKLALSTDRQSLANTFDDVAYITVKALDPSGIPHPWATHKITFTLEGPGQLLGVDNGARATAEPFQSTTRTLYEGQCIAIVRATATTGTITLKASSEGLEPATITLEAKK